MNRERQKSKVGGLSLIMGNICTGGDPGKSVTRDDEKIVSAIKNRSKSSRRDDDEDDGLEEGKGKFAAMRDSMIYNKKALEKRRKSGGGESGGDDDDVAANNSKFSGLRDSVIYNKKMLVSFEACHMVAAPVYFSCITDLVWLLCSIVPYSVPCRGGLFCAALLSVDCSVRTQP